MVRIHVRPLKTTQMEEIKKLAEKLINEILRIESIERKIEIIRELEILNKTVELLIKYKN